jgi:hypothetical protein
MYNDQDDEDDEFPLDDESAELMVCPHCRSEIYEDSQRCPKCDNYITPSISPWNNKPFVWRLFMVTIVLVLVWVFLRDYIGWLF